MTLPEANALSSAVDCRDADAIASALTARACAIAEFAASASLEVLKDTFASGEDLLNRLEQAQIESRRELDRVTNLRRGLSATLDRQTDHLTCFG